MMDFLKPLEQLLPMLKMGLYVVLALAAILALGVVTYVVRSTGGPVLRVLQWLCWYTPGTPPHPVVAGIAHGLRLVLWAALLALTCWLFSSFLWS